MTRRALALAVVLLTMSFQPAAAARQQPATRWITAWGASQNQLGPTIISNATVRMIARVAIGGDALRIRLDNTYGTMPLRIGSASVAPRIQGAAIAAGSSRPLRFNDGASVTIPAGGSVVSDPVGMKVLARSDLAVSLYVPDADVRPSQHGSAQVTSYITAPASGDRTADESATAFTDTTRSMFWLKAIDVASTTSSGAVVAFGDSITDGTCATVDAHDRWQDWVAVRLGLADNGRGTHKAIVNEGIGGNTVTRPGLQPPPDSTPGVERLERDVLSHHGVTHVVLFMGTNDIRRDAPAAQVIAGMQDIVTRVKARGIKILGVTIIPRHNRPAEPNNTGWNAAKTQIRNEVNRWMRSSKTFDGLIDMESVVRDPQNTDRINPPFDCGDGIHPSPRGYFEMGTSVPLDLFR